MARHNIVWTNEECKLLARHIVAHEADAQGAGVKVPRARIVREAVEEVLPKARQRDTKYPWALWTTLEPFVLKERARLAKATPVGKRDVPRIPTAPQEEFAPEPAPASQLEVKLNDLVQQLCAGLAKAISWEVATTVTNITKNMVIPVIAGEVRAALAAMTQPVSTEGLEAAVSRALEQHEPLVVRATDPLPEDVESVAIAPRDRLPRVAIIGLMHQQEEDVERQFKDCIEFTFIRTSNTVAANDFQLKLARKDVVILMTKFCSHWHDEQIKRSGVPVMRITGGVSMLKGWLQKWFNGEIGLAGMPAHDHSQGEQA